MPFTIASSYGYVLGVAAASTFLPLYHAGKVGAARKKAGIPYPVCYADAKEAAQDKHKYQFNCAQRAHGNLMEIYPMYLYAQLVGGLSAPKSASVLGIIWILGRAVYLRGYLSGNPKKRTHGSFSYIGYLGLVLLSFWTAYRLISTGEV